MIDPSAGPAVSLAADKTTVTITTPNGESIRTGVDYIQSLILMLGQANATAAGPESVQIFPVEWWNIIPDIEHPEFFLLYFRVQGTLQIAFRIHRSKGAEYIKQLQALLDKPIASPPASMN